MSNHQIMIFIKLYRYEVSFDNKGSSSVFDRVTYGSVQVLHQHVGGYLSQYAGTADG